MPQKFRGIFSKKIRHRAKNTIDRVGSLCYTKTIGKQERPGTERQEKWRAKKNDCFCIFWSCAYCCAYAISCGSIFWNFMFI